MNRTASILLAALALCLPATAQETRWGVSAGFVQPMGGIRDLSKTGITPLARTAVPKPNAIAAKHCQPIMRQSVRPGDSQTIGPIRPKAAAKTNVAMPT